MAWLDRTSKGTDLTISVCNGSFVLARAGLLSGKSATAHHGAYGMLAATFPDITVKRGVRFVDAGNVSTAGGLTSGIDLALHVVERYFGRSVAETTATQLEYQGNGWKDPGSNSAIAKKPVSTEARPLCPVCESEVDRKTALVGALGGLTHYFCSPGCRDRFLADPDRYKE